MAKKLCNLSTVLICLFLVLLLGAWGACGLSKNISAQIASVQADSVDSPSVLTLDEQLERYLQQLNGGQELAQDSFATTSELVFDGAQSSICNAIVQIGGLEQFDFSSVTTITIQNMRALSSIDLGADGTTIFPNLNTLVIANCASLVNFTYNLPNLAVLDISGCAGLNFALNSQNYQTLKTLSLGGIEGEEFGIDGTLPSLESLTLSGNTALNTVNLQAGSLRTAVFYDNIRLQMLCINSSSLRSLTLQENRALQALDLSRSISLREIVVDEMSFTEGDAVVERTLLYAPNLRKLFISANDWIESFDISQSVNLETLVVSDCTNLRKIDLPQDLSRLQTLDFSNCYNLSDVDFSSALNLQSLSLLECNLIDISNFESISNMQLLEYINLQNTNVRELALDGFNNLQILFIGSSYLTTLNLSNLPSLMQFSLSTSNYLSTIYINNLPNLQAIDFGACENVNNITITDVGVQTFSIAGKSQLYGLNIDCANLQSLYIYDCINLSNFDFGNCVNLQVVEILGCDSLGSEFVQTLNTLQNLTHLYVSECDTTFNFELSDKPTLNYLNISNLNNLNFLSLQSLGTSAQVLLPARTTTIRSLTLYGMPSANFGTTELDLSNGVLSAVVLQYLPFTAINLNNNAISSLTISNIDNLEQINLSNNRITNVDSIMALLEASQMLAEVNLNNNRLNLSSGDTLDFIQNSVYSQFVILGLQNILENNNYTYEPEIYFGGFGRFFTDVNVVVYHSDYIYARANLSDEVLNTFSRTRLSADRFYEYGNGTYYVAYEKVDNRGNAIEMSDEEKALFVPIYFTVSSQIDFVQFIWIIFVGVAGLIFLYVGISFFIERRRKARLLGEDLATGDESGTTLSRKEIKQAEREHRRLFKESEKMERQERRKQAILEREQKIQELEQARLEQDVEAESAKFAKEAEREQKKLEKDKLKLDKEQQKLEKQREKFAKERQKEQAKQEQKEQKAKEKAEQKALDIKEAPSKGEKMEPVNSKKNAESTNVVDFKAESAEPKNKNIDDKEGIEVFGGDKELKKEQRELKKLEKQNLKEEKRREKAEERALFGGAKGKKIEKFEPLEPALEEFGKDLSIDNGNKEDDLNDVGSVSDKDLENIINSKPSKASAPPMPPKMPKLPKK